MADTIKFHDSLPVTAGSSSTASESHEQLKGAAAAVSLAEIEQLFAMLEEEQTGKKKDDVAQGEKQLLDLISSLLKGIEGGKVDGKTMSTLQGLVSDFYKGDKTALGKILDVVMPAVLTYSQKHPNDLMGVIKALSPLMKDSGGEVMKKLQEADKYFGLFRTTYESSTDPKKGDKLAEILGKVFDQDKLQGVEDAMDLLEAEFEELLKEDPTKGKSIISAIYTMLTTYALSGADAAKTLADAILKSGSLKELMKLSPEDLKIALDQLVTTTNDLSAGKITADQAAQKMVIVIPTANPVYYKAATQKVQKDDPNLRDILAQAMMSLQLLQAMVSKAQAQQTQFTMEINQARTDAAIKTANDNFKKIEEAIEAQKKADEGGGWFGWLIKALLAVVAVVIAAVTAGVGAAIAAALIGAFMASPLMNMTVKAIADKISGAVYDKYYKQYKEAGKSDDEAKALAQEKADAVGNLIASIIVIIAVVIVSFGAGGIQGGEAGASAVAEGAEEGMEMTNFAESLTEDITEDLSGAEEASTASKFNWSGSLGAKVGAFEGLSAVGSTNIWMSAMQTDPEWCKEHQKLMMALDIVAELITMIMAMVAGGSAMKQANSNGAMLAEKVVSNFSKYSKWLLALSAGLQMGNSGYETYSASMKAKYLKEAADLTTDIGKLTAELTQINGSVAILQSTQKTTNKESVGMIKSMGDAMDSLESVAGLDGDMAIKAMLGQ